MLYLLDWDDTLAAGPMTWALEHVFPELVARYGLPNGSLDGALLRAQAVAASTYDESRLMAAFLADVGWPPEAAIALQRAVVADFEPTLFADTLPFLARLRTFQATVVVVSNNNRSLSVAARLGVTGLVSRFITPSMGFARKPARDMADAVAALDPATTVVVGDDPFTDVPFAAACGLPCSIVDRYARYGGLRFDGGVRVVTTLGEIPA